MQKYTILGNMEVLAPVADILDVSTDAIEDELQRLMQDPVFVNHLQYGPSRMPAAWLPYLACRILQPELVVETGVANGFSSYHILYALHRNDKGLLFSIDKPGHETYLHKTDELYMLRRAGRPIVNYLQGRETGWIVPGFLRPRWDLRLGLSSELLPKLLAEIKAVDVFLHDSEHTYECQMMEYTTVWPYLRPGGALISDDTHWNPAFEEFSCSVGEKHMSTCHVGVVRKSATT